MPKRKTWSDEEFDRIQSERPKFEISFKFDDRLPALILLTIVEEQYFEKAFKPTRRTN